jgi:hypothetical protein
MQNVELEVLSQVSGILGLLTLIVAFFYGSIVLKKGFKHKKKTLFYFFFTVIFTVSPWYPSGFGYLYWLLTKEVLPYVIYVIIGTFFVPIAVLSWFQIYMDALLKSKKKIITSLFSGLTIAFYIYMIYFLFFAQNAPVQELIGIKRNPIDIDYKGFTVVYLIICVFITISSGIHFSFVSMGIKDDKPVVWKGRFLLISFILFTIGAVGDSLIELDIISLIIIRFFMLISTTFFYIGFIMPKWMQKILKLEKQQIET